MGNQIVEPLKKRLIYAKYIFSQASEMLTRSLPLWHGLGISLLQDSVELVLRAIAQKVKARIGGNITFAEYWDKIERVSGNKESKMIPYKTEMQELNRARVGFKHYGILPASDDADRFRTYTRDFLVNTYRTFFDEEFDVLSLAELVRHCRARNHIRHAEQALVSDDFATCIEETAVAFTVLSLNRRAGLEHLRLPQRIETHDLGKLVGADIEAERALDNFIRALEEHFDTLSSWILPQLHGINMAEYARFRAVTPGVSLSVAHTCYFWGGNEAAYTKENAEFCVRFVIDSALQIDRTRFYIPSGFDSRTRKVRVIKDGAEIILCPVPNDVELIRLAGKGEVLERYYGNREREGWIEIFQDDDLAYIKGSDVESIFSSGGRGPGNGAPRAGSDLRLDISDA
ncbi:hypothetical protein E3J62_09155 [candidate division TA06 bacterium]|uniref:Uncharacterized protein n=1 Tax=candidate division TA06 bacterium TaxID=2250710 RepID=A0A523URC9_UNCT6|nr:MAG: hypothetical protein E3J62_09155 [candidate division TA06 bacterium]